MKRMFKTIIALCLTIAMLSSLFTGVTFAAEEVYVEWYGFDATEVTAALGEGSYTSAAPSFFPSNATLKDVTWSVSDENIATVDANGVVTFLTDGEVMVTAKLVNDDEVVDVGLKSTGASYELTITSDLLKAKPGEVNFVAANKKKDVEIAGVVGTLKVDGSSDERVATATKVDDGLIQVSSKSTGYAEITVSDDNGPLVIPVYVSPTSVSDAKANWEELFPDDAASAAAKDDPYYAGYLQWWLEAIPINTAAAGSSAGTGVLGYGEPLKNAQNMVIANAGDTDSNGKTHFLGVEKEYPYYNLTTGASATANDHYQMLAIRAKKGGKVNIKPRILSITTNSVSDGFYLAIFRTDAEGKMWRVFPENEEDDEQKTDSKTAMKILNVTKNWLWVYPAATAFGKFEVGDVYEKWNADKTGPEPYLDFNGEPYTLTQEKADLRKDFETNGCTFEVQEGEVIRVVIHFGNDSSSDGMNFMPVFSYVESNVDGLLDSETEVEILKGETTQIRARLNPIGTEADIDIEPVCPNGTVVDVEEYDYVPYDENNVSEYGYVNIKLSADADSADGTGYYRMKYGNYTQLIAVSVVSEEADEDEDGETGEDVEDGSVSWAEWEEDNSNDDDPNPDDPNPDDPNPDDSDPFESFFNEENTTLSVVSVTLPGGRNSNLSWKHKNTATSGDSYYVYAMTPTGGSAADIHLDSLPTNFKDGEFTADAESEVTKSLSFSGFVSSGRTYDVFWFFGAKNDLAKNGLRLMHMELNKTR